jgi:hypothetical protein
MDHSVVTFAEEPELIIYLTRLTGLPAGQCERLVQDILAQFNETVDEFVQRRHLELKARGYKNADIYEQVRREVALRRFVAPVLSERQIRRLIYG